MQLSVRGGEGNEGPNGGINGDLIGVVIEEIAHEDFVRDGQNVLIIYWLLSIWCMVIPLLKYHALQVGQRLKYS